MQDVQDYLATYYPDRFSIDTWQDLLPEFINAQIVLYRQQLASYELAISEWEESDQSTTAPVYPVMPTMFVQACEEQAKREGLNFRSLACSLYIGRERVEHYRKESEHYKTLCGEMDEASMELVQNHLALAAGTTLGKWLN